MCGIEQLWAGSKTAVSKEWTSECSPYINTSHLLQANNSFLEHKAYDLDICLIVFDLFSSHNTVMRTRFPSILILNEEAETQRSGFPIHHIVSIEITG